MKYLKICIGDTSVHYYLETLSPSSPGTIWALRTVIVTEHGLIVDNRGWHFCKCPSDQLNEVTEDQFEVLWQLGKVQ